MPSWLPQVLFQTVLTVAVALATSRWFWRFQARGKRQSEVAEAAYVAFQDILDVLEHCRLGSSRLPVPHAEPPPERVDEPTSGQEFFWVYRRLRGHSSRFIEIRKHRILLDTYFGSDAAKPFMELEIYIQDLYASCNRGIAASKVLEHRWPDINDAVREAKRDAREKLDEAYDFVFADNKNPRLKRLLDGAKTLERFVRSATR